MRAELRRRVRKRDSAEGNRLSNALQGDRGQTLPLGSFSALTSYPDPFPNFEGELTQCSEARGMLREHLSEP